MLVFICKIIKQQVCGRQIGDGGAKLTSLREDKNVKNY